MRDPVYRHRLTDYDRGLVPCRFVAGLDEGAAVPQDWLARSGRSIGHPGWGLLYHLVLTRLDPDRDNLIVETGTNWGSSTLVLAQAIRDSRRSGRIRTIELDPVIYEEARRRAALAGLDDLIDFHCGDSLTVLPGLLAEGEVLAVAFLDGNHFHDHVVTEFELVRPYLAHDSLVVFDNTYLIAEGAEDPRVHGALRTIVDRHGGSLVNLPFASWYTPGIAIWQAQPFTEMAPPAPGSFVPNS